jgi:hypothetical protein
MSPHYDLAIPRPQGSLVQPQPTDPSNGPVGALRGATVDVDTRRLGRVVVGMVLVTLATIAGILFAAGAQKNSQIDELHQHGVPVGVTVTGCTGQLGGSGSNAAGYACRGTYTYAGRHYEQAIPGYALRAPGTVVHAVIVPSDPALLSTSKALSDQQASWRVFVVPSVLVLALLAGIGLVVGRSWRSGRRPSRELLKVVRLDTDGVSRNRGADVD